MQQFVTYLLIIFLLYQPIFFGVLIYLYTKTDKDLDIEVVSTLGTGKFPHNKIFNVSLSLYGLLSLALPISLYYLLNDISTVNFLTITALVACGIGTILLGLYPMDKNELDHEVAAVITFGGMFVVGATIMTVLAELDLLENISIFFSLAISGFVVFLFIHYLITKKISAKVEWIAILFAVMWNTLITYNLGMMVYLEITEAILIQAIG